MRLGILGDIHGYVSGSNTRSIDFAVHLTVTLPVAAFLQVGDMCHYQSFSRPVYGIWGNNDWPDVVRQIDTGERPLRHLHHVKTGAVVTLSDGQQEVRLGGLNGAFDPLYYDLEDGPQRPVDSLPYFVRADVEKCLRLPPPVDIFLAHGCPAGLGDGREPDYSVAALRDILDVVQPRVMFCGHAHFFREAHSNTSTVYALNQLKKAYYIFATQDGTLKRFASRSVL